MKEDKDVIIDLVVAIAGTIASWFMFGIIFSSISTVLDIIAFKKARTSVAKGIAITNIIINIFIILILISFLFVRTK